MKVLAVTTNFGFGPVSKLVTILEKILSCSQVSITFCGTGQSKEYVSNNLKDKINYIEYDTETVTANQIHNIMKNYDLLINVMGFHIQKIATVDVLQKSVFIDSLSWMWNEPISNIEHCSVYFIQKGLDSFKTRFSYANSIEVNPIINPKFSKFEILPHDFILVNIAGIYMPQNNDNFGINYLDFWMHTIKSLDKFKMYKVIFACNSNQKEYFEKIQKSGEENNFIFKVFTHQGFLQAANKAKIILSTPGITFYFESISLGLNVFYLLPSNYSQYLLLEEYVKNGAKGLAFSSFGKQYEIKQGLEEYEGIRLTRNVFSLITKEYSNKIKEILNTELSYKDKAYRTNIFTNGADQIYNELVKRNLID